MVDSSEVPLSQGVQFLILIRISNALNRRKRSDDCASPETIEEEAPEGEPDPSGSFPLPSGHSTRLLTGYYRGNSEI
jgi:hypothetical protein